MPTLNELYKECSADYYKTQDEICALMSKELDAIKNKDFYLFDEIEEQVKRAQAELNRLEVVKDYLFSKM